MAHYLREGTMKCVRQGTTPDPNKPLASQSNTNCIAAMADGMRAATGDAVSMGGVSCDAAKLKLAVYPAENLIATPIPNPVLVGETSTNLK